MSEFFGWLFFKKSLGFGAQIGLTTFATFLVYRVNQVILAYMVSAEQVGLYIVAVSLAEKLRLLPNSIASAFLPRLANELSARQSQVPMVFRCTTIVSIGSMLLVGILGTPALLVLFGWDYAGTIPSFLLLLPGIAALGGASVLSGDLAVREKPKYGVWISYSVLVVNIALNFCLIPFIGIAGAALASTISYILACCMAILFYRHESRLPLKEMIPRWKDVMYVLHGLVSMVRQIILLGSAKLKSMSSTMGIRKRQL
jgi:O-antigen/teichoic acid export membrane protein